MVGGTVLNEESDTDSGYVIKQYIGLAYNNPYSLPLIWRENRKEESRCWNSVHKTCQKNLFFYFAWNLKLDFNTRREAWRLSVIYADTFKNNLVYFYPK